MISSQVTDSTAQEKIELAKFAYNAVRDDIKSADDKIKAVITVSGLVLGFAISRLSNLLPITPQTPGIRVLSTTFLCIVAALFVGTILFLGLLLLPIVRKKETANILDWKVIADASPDSMTQNYNSLETSRILFNLSLETHSSAQTARTKYTAAIYGALSVFAGILFFVLGFFLG